MQTLRIQPRGALIVRDGRPFAATPGARAVSLPWPLPSTLAGAVRTRIGDDLHFDWRSEDAPRRARAIGVAGPIGLACLPGAHTWSVYLPAPRDAVSVRDGQDTVPRLIALRPERPGAGGSCDLPHPHLRPLLPAGGVDLAKPERGNAWWPLDFLAAWLADPGGQQALHPQCLDHPPRETRVHVAIDRVRETARRGFLFTTEGISFADPSPAPWLGAAPARALLCRVWNLEEHWQPGATSFLTLGGERRLAEIQPSGVDWPVLPALVRAALAGTRRLRLVLATPALFQHGWRPAWLDATTLEGSPPAVPGLRLRLVGAAVGRREAVSGWDLQARHPKAVRFLVPAGSTFFFEIVSGMLDEEDTKNLWLASICDGEQDRRDGFGLAVPGSW